MSEQQKRTAFYVDETMWTPMGYIPSVVTEGEPGHTPLAGDPEKGQAPWYWGTSLDVAQFLCRQANKDKGLTEDDVRTIVASSIFASNRAARHDDDGNAYIAYYRNDLTLGFVWSGDTDDPVQVQREMGEPIFAEFAITRPPGAEMNVKEWLTTFREACDRWAEGQWNDVDLCESCRVPEHDQCPLVDGCRCCDDTRRRMDDEADGAPQDAWEYTTPSESFPAYDEHDERL